LKITAVSSAKFVVSGKVQGVFFRASARTQAQELGLSGYAKNLPNGDVEVLASGTDAALDALERWLHVGPPAAQVARVLRATIEIAQASGFRVL
jgi:acylphosphatase